MVNCIIKYKELLLLTIGTILVVLSICLFLYDKIELLKSNVFDEIEMEKYRELQKNDTTNQIEENDNIIDSVDVEDIDEKEENTTSNNNQANESFQKEIIGYLEIKKINLKQGLVSKKSYYNNVNRNIQILNASDYPDKKNGNVILAAHSGTSSISYFKNLYKLSINDEAKIYYKGYIYSYKIVKIYNVPKTGMVLIDHDVNKNTLTLITCTHNSKTEQTVYILELTSSIKDGDK